MRGGAPGTPSTAAGSPAFRRRPRGGRTTRGRTRGEPLLRVQREQPRPHWWRLLRAAEHTGKRKEDDVGHPHRPLGRPQSDRRNHGSGRPSWTRVAAPRARKFGPAGRGKRPATQAALPSLRLRAFASQKRRGCTPTLKPNGERNKQRDTVRNTICDARVLRMPLRQERNIGTRATLKYSRLLHVANRKREMREKLCIPFPLWRPTRIPKAIAEDSRGGFGLFPSERCNASRFV